MGRGETRTQVKFPARRKWNIVFGVSTICAQQTAKNWRKSPKGFFDKLESGLLYGRPLFNIVGIIR